MSYTCFIWFCDAFPSFSTHLFLKPCKIDIWHMLENRAQPAETTCKCIQKFLLLMFWCTPHTKPNPYYMDISRSSLGSRSGFCLQKHKNKQIPRLSSFPFQNSLLSSSKIYLFILLYSLSFQSPFLVWISFSLLISNLTSWSFLSSEGFYESLFWSTITESLCSEIDFSAL